MMLYGEKIKGLVVLLLFFSFLFLASCNKKSIENQISTNKEETKQEAAITNEKQTEKTNAKTTEKEIPSTQKTEIITTITNNSGDNKIVFDVWQETEKISINPTNKPETSENIIIDNTKSEPASQSVSQVTVPATDSDGWVTKWY